HSTYSPHRKVMTLLNTIPEKSEPVSRDSKPRPKFRVAISGGGIAGSYLAVALSKYPDIHVNLYEAAERFTEVGAGLTVWGRTWAALSSIGVESTLRDVETASAATSPSCDGMKSAVRRCMMEKKVSEGLTDFSKYIDPVWTGRVAYRVLIPVERFPISVREDPNFVRPVKHIVRYCIADGSMMNVVGFVSQPELAETLYDSPWSTECETEEFINCYPEWEPEVLEMLKLADKPMKLAIHDLRPLPVYVSGNVALVGDAAHAMTPHQGTGAGQAIEDACVLASLLGHPSTTLDTLSCALKAYEEIRLPFANNVLMRSRLAGLLYEFNSECGDDYTAIHSILEHQFDWVDGDGVKQQIQKALTKMEDRK
ncbi:hypothetical protein PHLCEN_2v10862, partial [Hermanssonia centrifuga]